MYYATIRYGKITYIIEGPYDVRLNAEMARDDYFFTSYDLICNETPANLKITEPGSFPVAMFSVRKLPDWSNGSLYGIKIRPMDNKDLF